MKFYLFIFSVNARAALITGYTEDIIKTIASFKKMPNLFNPQRDFKQLVYLEMFTTNQGIIDRHKEVEVLTRQQKDELIATVNPEWIELKPGVNIDL